MEPQDLSLQDILDTFINEILAELPLGDSTPEQLSLVRELIVGRVDKRLIALIVQELPEDRFQTLLQGVEGKELSEEQELSLIADAIDQVPNFSGKLAQALGELKNELVEDITEIQRASERDELGGEQPTQS